jgi:transposase-like protein
VEGINYPRILVAADQLEQAREVAARPIPQSIVELSKMPPEEYEPPVCPKCGAEDPLLEGVDPVNSWLCESCDHQWTDAVEEKSIPN